MKKKRMKIYESRLHLFFTFLVIVAPFLYLFFFAQYTDISGKRLALDILASISRLIVAYAIAVVLAWICGVFFYRGTRALVALPIFDLLQSFPAFAILPLVSYFFAPSNMTIIFFLVIAVIWPILFSIISSLKLIKHDWEEAVIISRLSGSHYVRLFLLPITIPGLITGSIIGLGEGWEAIVATEIIVNAKIGLGDFFLAHSSSPGITVFGVLGLLILIFSINKLFWLPLLDWSHRSMEE